METDPWLIKDRYFLGKTEACISGSRVTWVSNREAQLNIFGARGRSSSAQLSVVHTGYVILEVEEHSQSRRTYKTLLHQGSSIGSIAQLL